MADNTADASGISLTQYLASVPEKVAAADDVGDTFAPPAPLEPNPEAVAVGEAVGDGFATPTPGNLCDVGGPYRCPVPRNS